MGTEVMDMILVSAESYKPVESSGMNFERIGTTLRARDIIVQVIISAPHNFPLVISHAHTNFFHIPCHSITLQMC